MRTDTLGLRVCHIVRSLNVGGLERVVIDLIRGLRQEGTVNFLACLIEPGDWASEAAVDELWCGRLPDRGPLVTFATLCRFLRKAGVTVIHTHNSHPHKYGAPASVVTGIPLVHTKHGRNWPDNPRWVWLSRQLSRVSRFIVPVSRDIERIVLDREHIPARKVQLVVNGADPEYYSPGPSPFRQSYFGSAVVIGSMGRFSPEKRYTQLVKAFAAVKQRVAEARLVLVGDGSERAHIESVIRSCGRGDSVLLPGMTKQSVEWLRAMDVFCLASEQEGTSRTLVEAGLCGVPAVVTCVGGNSEIVEDGKTGFVVAPDDFEGLVQRLVQLGRDEALRITMGRAARERMIARYSLQQMVKSYQELYRRAAGIAPKVTGHAQ